MDFVIKTNVPLGEASGLLRDLVRRKMSIVVIGMCRVDYEGRSASRLEPGERIVMIKQDGAVLVHGPTGYSPLNWQPDTSAIEVYYRDGIGLIIHAVRDKPREYLTVTFGRVDLIVARRLIDQGEFIMYVDENEMRDILVSNPSLIEPGLRVVEIEKRVGDGYVDIYASDSQGKPVLVELKRITATKEAVMQLYRYIEAYTRETGIKPRGILVAPAFSPTALESLLRLGLEYRYVDLKKIWELVKTTRQTHRPSIIDYTKRQSINENTS